jgi:hypothetical protein
MLTQTHLQCYGDQHDGGWADNLLCFNIISLGFLDYNCLYLISPSKTQPAVPRTKLNRGRTSSLNIESSGQTSCS